MSEINSFSVSSVNSYSQAFYELASENNLVDLIEKQALSVLKVIMQSEEFKILIKDPTNKKDIQLKVINKIVEKNKFNSLFKNFLNFLIKKRRFFFIERILKSFIDTCSRKRRELKAELKSAKNYCRVMK